MKNFKLKSLISGFLSFFSRKKLLIFSGDPYLDWKIIVLSFFAVILFSAGFCFYLFNGINKGAFFIAKAKSEVKISSVKQEALEIALNYFVERDKLFENVGKEALVPDPSI
jgi:hypothetical protein